MEKPSSHSLTHSQVFKYLPIAYRGNTISEGEVAMSKDYTGVVLLAFIALLALYVYPWRVLALIGGIVVVLAVQIGIHFIYEKYQKWYWREKK